MNRKRIALLTSLTMFSGLMLNNASWLKDHVTHEVYAEQVKLSLKPNKKYPDIAKTLDLTSLEQYPSTSLFMNVTLNKFVVIDVGLNSNNIYQVLLAPIKSSDQYLLVTLDTDCKIKKGQKLTIQGFINGKDKVRLKQINGGISRKYLNQKVVTMLTDSFSIE